jgi:hypoxanthine phosphoribosyltransferase
MTTQYHPPLRQSAGPEPPDSASANFANASEAEFARILDFYHIVWQYEPRAFAIAWDEAGNITSSFTPDFYLPEHNLYIELTTLRQPLVTRKNRKIRRLRELYPEVTLKVFYGADYRKLLEKFAGSGAWQEAIEGNDDES